PWARRTGVRRGTATGRRRTWISHALGGIPTVEVNPDYDAARLDEHLPVGADDERFLLAEVYPLAEPYGLVPRRSQAAGVDPP
ncbi:MAG TPA: hypothetical protein VK324_17590, partial [Tepidisphaeraceae bacterium]|nr:hypothetical protein [Tepidisphaeraceae bacterium]